MALALLQTPSIYSGTSTTPTKAFAGATTNGSLIVVCVTAEDSAITASCSDNTNGAYGSAAAHGTVSAGGVNAQAWIFTKQNSGTTTPTITVTFSATPNYAVVKIYEISGQDATPVDVAGGLDCTDGVPATLILTTVAANDMILTQIVGYPAIYAVESGYTEAFAAQAGVSDYHWGEYRVDVGAAGGKTLAYGGITAGGNYAAAAVAIRVVQGPTNATATPSGAAGTAAAGTATAVPLPPPPYTLTTVTG